MEYLKIAEYIASIITSCDIACYRVLYGVMGKEPARNIRITIETQERLHAVLKARCQPGQRPSMANWLESKAVEEIAAYEAERGVELVVEGGEVVERVKE